MINIFPMKERAIKVAIKVQQIRIKKNKYEVHFSVDGRSKPFFKEIVYKAEYSFNEEPLDLSGVPESVLVIPFLCNILPIVWLENETLFVECVDEDFYNCIENIRNEYCNAFGDTLFKGGTVCANKIEKNVVDWAVDQSGLFYSGGVDSNYSLLSHRDEKLVLQLIWGNMDMNYSKKEGFDGLYQNAKSMASRYGLPLIIIRSNYRDILNRVELNAKYENILKIRWWLGVQHLIALAGLSAPCNYAQKIRTQYIAPSFSEDLKIGHTRYPENVDCIQYFGCRIHQDLSIARQKKVRAIVEESNLAESRLELHVCFRAQNGKNCCTCEKCAITILELMSEGADPNDYGFMIDRDIINTCIERCKRKAYDLNITPFLDGMRASLERNKNEVKKLPYGEIVVDSFLKSQ